MINMVSGGSLQFRVRLDGAACRTTYQADAGRLRIELIEEIVIKEKQYLEIELKIRN